MQDFLGRNWFLIFFIYGLAFFLMGHSVAFEARRASSLPLGRKLRLLAGFGLLHGVAEWVYIFAVPTLAAGGWQTLRGSVLGGGHAVLVALSFAFLFAFGSSLTLGERPRGRRLAPLPWAVLLLWLAYFLADAGRHGGDVPEWLAENEIWARYFLALPGAALSSWGLWRQRQALRRLGDRRLEGSFAGGALAFLLYALAGGLVVPPAGFFPASHLNTTLLINFGLPVQVLRATSGLLMAFFMIRALDLFEVEARREREEARQREALWEQREKIRRDIHDGVIQNIYSLGLGLEQCGQLLGRQDLPALRAHLAGMVQLADRAIEDLRGYLGAMDEGRLYPRDPLALARQVLDEFAAASGIKPKLSRRGEAVQLSTLQAEHLYFMLKEALSNVYRHAGAGRVEVVLVFGAASLEVSVQDDGRGFDPVLVAPGEGLKNLQRRARLAGGDVRLDSAPGQGTVVRLELPYR